MHTPHANPAGRMVRFGVFELDAAAGELRKSGRRVRLQEQPFQILALLLERPGEIVSREELREKLWPADTFVDFDHSLNTAVKKIREALGDSASTPCYVETIARRGYRFLAPLQRDRPVTGEPATIPAEAPGGGSPGIPLHPDLEIPLPKRGTTRGLFVLIQVMYLAFYAAALVLLHGVEFVTQSFLPGRGPFAIEAVALVTAGIGIPLRLYLLSAAAFDHRRLGQNFQRIFAFVLALDELWAAAPFLLTQQIGFGAAFAATAALLYVPFSERTLIKMAYPAPV